MTCIVGLIHEGEIYMGGDSGRFSGWDLEIMPEGKVVKKGEFLMGCSGDARMGDLVRYAFNPPPFEEGENVNKYMVTTFVDALRECLKQAGYARKESEQEKTGSTLLVGVRGKLFSVSHDYCVTEDAHPYTAIGCGESYAKGVMCVTDVFDWSPQNRIKQALEAAERHSAGVRGPFTFVSTAA